MILRNLNILLVRLIADAEVAPFMAPSRDVDAQISFPVIDISDHL